MTEDWYIEAHWGKKAWHAFADAHRAVRGTHTLEYCLKYIKANAQVFRNGMKNNVSYRLHDHVSQEIIPLDALGL